MTTVRRGLALVLVGVVVGVWGALPAAADIITPAGACSGTGRWVDGKFTEQTVDHVPSDVIDVPIKDVVRYQGRLEGGEPGETTERRDISGRVELELPLGQSFTVNDWGGSSVLVAKGGRHKYDLPFFLKGVEMRLKGHHDEDGQRVCSGSVYVKVEGSALSNPLTWVGIVAVVASAGGLIWASRPKMRTVDPMYEGTDPAMRERAGGHPVVGAFAGLVLGGAVGGLLLMFGAIPLHSIVLVIAPIVGLVLGVVLGLLTPLGPPVLKPPEPAREAGRVHP